MYNSIFNVNKNLEKELEFLKSRKSNIDKIIDKEIHQIIQKRFMQEEKDVVKFIEENKNEINNMKKELVIKYNRLINQKISGLENQLKKA